MRSYFIIIILAGFMSSCTQNNSTNQPDNKAVEKTREEVISSVENYLKEKLKDPRVSVDEFNMICISDSVAGYQINQSKIVIGKIDEDKVDDAVVPVYTLRGQSVMEYDHLIVLNSAGIYKVVKTMKDVFNIHAIKNRKIFAEVSTVSPDSPGFGCDECKEVVKYKYRDGELVRIE
jgi:hypothetical protein